jgi:hypothetical protein
MCRIQLKLYNDDAEENRMKTVAIAFNPPNNPSAPKRTVPSTAARFGYEDGWPNWGNGLVFHGGLLPLHQQGRERRIR